MELVATYRVCSGLEGSARGGGALVLSWSVCRQSCEGRVSMH